MFSRVFKYKGFLSKLSIAFHGCIRLELDLGIILPLMYSLLTVSKSGIALRSKVMYSSGVRSVCAAFVATVSLQEFFVILL